MNALSLCAGIGGIDLGLKLADPASRTVCYVEQDPFCQDVLLARMADGVLDRAPIWGDLKRFDAYFLRGLVDVVHGGYPCQPFSVAGKRAGADDPRHLWPDIARVVRECEPEWCFFENVAGHLTLGFDVVARDLEAMGYRIAAGLFTAAEVGAPHRRQRLYVLAQRHGQYDDGGRSARAGRRAQSPDGRDGVGDTDDPRLEGRSEPERKGADEWPTWPPGPEERYRWGRVLAVRPELAPATVADPTHGRSRDTGGGCEPWGSAEGDAPQPALRRVAHGFPHRVDRLKALGNAVVPDVAALAWRTLR